MPITTRLSRKLHQTLGDEAANDLVNWMQQVDVQRVEFREWLELKFSGLDARLTEARADLADLRQNLHALDTKTQVGFAQLRQEMHSGLAGVETKLEQRTADLMKWSFVFWVGAVGAIALLAGVLR